MTGRSWKRGFFQMFSCSVMPYVEKLKKNHPDPVQQVLVNFIEFEP